MVSFHTTQVPTQRNVFPNIEDLSKKRKWDDELKAEDQISYEKPQKAKTMTSLFGTQLHLETPLPLEWQRCLDIKVCKKNSDNYVVPISLDVSKNNILYF